MEKLILVTNDDGIEAPGLKALAFGLKKLGRVVVIAPDKERSAASHAVTLYSPLKIERLGAGRIKVDGTPADCVMLAVKKILKRKPDLVAAGINPGPNLGDDVNYSGTVSAALEGTMLGIPSFSVSMAGRQDLKFETAGIIAARIARLIFTNGLPPRIALNVNVPNLTLAQLKGVAITRQGLRIYRDRIELTKDPEGRTLYWITGEEPGWEDEEETDCKAIENKLVSITPLHPDLTSHRAMSHLSGWSDIIYEGTP
jgi:5'-nucleotidase